jgi:hypothetical protein
VRTYTLEFRNASRAIAPAFREIWAGASLLLFLLQLTHPCIPGKYKLPCFLPLLLFCRYYTPGVHHLYFYLPGTQGSRVIARLQRRWMPPSSTWLFPPITETHDRGGWVVEWEGHEAQQKSGWMHPAVFVLTAGCYSYDIEARRQAGQGVNVMQEKAAEWGRQLGQVLQWLRSKW